MSSAEVYSFDVALSSHDLLRQGQVEPYWSRVVVAASSESDAALLAAQLAHAAHGGMMVTRVLYRF